ncbi:MAG: hypothetical protein WCF17_10325 [Terracidiphilus sp.]
MTMQNRSIALNLGVYVYGAAAIFLGVVGLVSGNFAVGWQHVGPNVPLREPLAYLAGLIELAAGIALLAPRTARIGAVTLTAVYSVFTLLWAPNALVDIIRQDYGFRLRYDATGNVFEEFSMVAAGLVLCAILLPAGSWVSRRQALFARVFVLCPISFGIEQISDTMRGLTGWIPKWLPPGQLFWAYATTICFFLAAAAILTGIMASLAARLLTAEIVGFQLLVWIPKLAAGPHEHFNWAGNGINLAIAASVWVVADSISRAAKRKTAAEESAAGAGSVARAGGVRASKVHELRLVSGRRNAARIHPAG